MTQLLESPVDKVQQNEGIVSFRGNHIVFKECGESETNCKVETLDTTTGIKRTIISFGDCLLGEPVTDLSMAPNALDENGMPVFMATNIKGVTGIFRTLDVVPSYGGALANIQGLNTGTVGSPVNLDASQSSSENGNDLGYEWQLISKPSQSGADFNASSKNWIQTNFVPDVPGQYTVRLTAKTCDSAGPFFSTKDLTILVGGEASGNNPPEPKADPIWVAKGQSGVTSVSPDDPDAGQSHTFDITIQPQHGTAAVSGGGEVSYTPTAGYEGADSLAVTVTDNGTPQKTGTVTISIFVGDPSANRPPVAILNVATPSQVLARPAQLDGSSSYDPDGSIQTYTWTIVDPPGGGGASISGQGTSKAQISATKFGAYTIKLKVSDGLLTDEKTAVVAFGSAAFNGAGSDSQADADWGEDRVLGSKLSSDTMTKVGCLVSSLSNTLKGIGFENFADGTPINPGSLNRRILNFPKHGYLHSDTGGLIKDFIPQIFGHLMEEYKAACHGDIVCLAKYDKELRYELQTENISRDDIYQRIESGLPTILMVPRYGCAVGNADCERVCTPQDPPSCQQEEKHYITPSGMRFHPGDSRPEILVNDSGRRRTVSLDYGSYDNNSPNYSYRDNPFAGRILGVLKFQVVQRRPRRGNRDATRALVDDLSALYLHLEGKGDVLLTDPSGRRLGLDPVAQEFFQEIPNGIYSLDGPSSIVAAGELPWQRTVAIQSAPLSGGYHVKVFGFTGCQKVGLMGRSIDGDFAPISNQSVCLSAGQVGDMQFDFDPGQQINSGTLSITRVDVSGTTMTYAGRIGATPQSIVGKAITIATNGFDSFESISSSQFQPISGGVEYSSSTTGIRRFQILENGDYTLELYAPNEGTPGLDEQFPLGIGIGNTVYSSFSPHLERPSDGFTSISTDKTQYNEGESANITLRQLYLPNEASEVVYRVRLDGGDFILTKRSNGLFVGRTGRLAVGQHVVYATAVLRDRKIARKLTGVIESKNREIKRIERRMFSGVSEAEFQRLAIKRSALVERVEAASTALSSMEHPLASETAKIILVNGAQ